MPHPKEVRKRKGKLWHLEDQKLTLSDARVLKRHLSKTEDKKVRVTHNTEGYQVWWSK